MGVSLDMISDLLRQRSPSLQRVVVTSGALPNFVYWVSEQSRGAAAGYLRSRSQGGSARSASGCALGPTAFDCTMCGAAGGNGRCHATGRLVAEADTCVAFALDADAPLPANERVTCNVELSS